jgi:hypothetical protein
VQLDIDFIPIVLHVVYEDVILFHELTLDYIIRCIAVCQSTEATVVRVATEAGVACVDDGVNTTALTRIVHLAVEVPVAQGFLTASLYTTLQRLMM